MPELSDFFVGGVNKPIANISERKVFRSIGDGAISIIDDTCKDSGRWGRIVAAGESRKFDETFSSLPKLNFDVINYFRSTQLD